MSKYKKLSHVVYKCEVCGQYVNEYRLTYCSGRRKRKFIGMVSLSDIIVRNLHFKAFEQKSLIAQNV